MQSGSFIFHRGVDLWLDYLLMFSHGFITPYAFFTVAKDLIRPPMFLEVWAKTLHTKCDAILIEACLTPKIHR